MSRMHTHPDGTEFTSAKGLMDYVDNLKEIEDVRERSIKEARFNDLIARVDVVDKRKTRWHAYHDNMLNV